MLKKSALDRSVEIVEDETDLRIRPLCTLKENVQPCRDASVQLFRRQAWQDKREAEPAVGLELRRIEVQRTLLLRSRCQIQAEIAIGLARQFWRRSFDHFADRRSHSHPLGGLQPDNTPRRGAKCPVHMPNIAGQVNRKVGSTPPASRIGLLCTRNMGAIRSPDAKSAGGPHGVEFKILQSRSAENRVLLRRACHPGQDGAVAPITLQNA